MREMTDAGMPVEVRRRGFGGVERAEEDNLLF
jgi:hypothetical protein